MSYFLSYIPVTELCLQLLAEFYVLFSFITTCYWIVFTIASSILCLWRG